MGARGNLSAVAEHRLGLALVTASAIAWSTAGLFTRFLALDSWTMLVWRGLFGALGIAVFMLAREGAAALTSLRKPGWPGWLFAIVSGIGMILFITSLRHTTVAHVAVISAATPFAAAMLGWMLIGEKPTRRAAWASVAAFAGVVVMVGFSVEGSLFGDLLAFGMTLAVASMMVIARHFRSINATAAACISALLSGLVCWPLGSPMAVSGHDLFILALFGLVNSALGLTFFTIGARLIPAIETALIGALDAPLAPLWVWLIFGETPGLSTLAGGAIVLAAVVHHVLTSSGTEPSGATSGTNA